MNDNRATRRCELVVLLAAAAGLVSCGGGGSVDDALATPCVIKAEDPAITVDSASSSGDGSAIGTLQFSAVTLGGIPFPIDVLGPTTNIVVVGGVATCTVPCSFGNAEGAYTWRAEAPGFAAKAVTLDVNYKVHTKQGCTIVLQGGVTASVKLDPIP